ncbi:HAD family hydrolase [Methyloceanibacter sp.]|uniref:HAD family hydrolase n=1 Tax=Methyloceanibacter sp. TaxID=1965321 RepID=UPI002D50A447|nr:HAD family hydrolase [Methyloceanibacter sp.]HZP09690.1 HAD family hydrolase [Methyloceanibacter sp.]
MLENTTIVFDLDGTLVDTAPDLTHALNYALARAGHPPVSAETVRSLVGMGAQVMIAEGLRRAGVTADLNAMFGDFLVHYEANIAKESRPFPGAVAALERLRQDGARLAVCTNKRESLSRRLLQALDLEGYFSAIAGRDTFAVAKPDPGHLTGAIRLAGGDPSRAVMIGDSDVDVRTAKAAKVPVVLVSFGYCGPPPSLRPESVIDHFDQLDASLAALLASRRRAAPQSA